MKKSLIVLLLVFCFALIANAEEEKEVTYRVTIEVVYNAVSLEEAKEIMADAMERHQDACKVDVKAKKGVDDYVASTAGTTDWYYPFGTDARTTLTDIDTDIVTDGDVHSVIEE